MGNDVGGIIGRRHAHHAVRTSSFVSSPLSEITSGFAVLHVHHYDVLIASPSRYRAPTEELRRTISVRLSGLPVSSRTTPEIITADAPSVEATIAMRALSCEHVDAGEAQVARPRHTDIDPALAFLSILELG